MAVAHNPTPVKGMRQQLPSQSSRNMQLALGPIHAGARKGLATVGSRRRLWQADPQFLPGLIRAGAKATVFLDQLAALQKPCGHCHRQRAGKVVVATAQLSNGSRLAPLGPVQVVTGGYGGQLLQNSRHLGAGKTVKHATSPFLCEDQSGLLQHAQMRRGSLGGDACRRGQLLVGKGAPLHQLTKHPGAAGIAKGLANDIKSRCDHGLTLPQDQGLAQGNPFAVARSVYPQPLPASGLSKRVKIVFWHPGTNRMGVLPLWPRYLTQK
eukprot:GHVR01127265.1.p1 GENE.GHVR01127265.1~~GHVR01127265.1.p1  ORF type:complete len:267 (-),score=28.53 GHVR01127265.1:193-993(-)